MRSRRFLPSLSYLSAFEAVLRTGSTTAAARELNLTQSTVSRMIQSLERLLGRTLFERQRQRLVPTERAIAYGRDVSRALDLIQAASIGAAANPNGGALALAILPAFGTRWLAPRLGDFLSRTPDVTVNLSTRLQRFDFASSAFDAAIHFGMPDWRDAKHLKLFDEHLTACIAPVLLQDRPVKGAGDLAQWSLLRLETRPTAWRVWFEAQGETAQEPTGMMFDQFATMTQAAIAGLGVALLPDYLAEGEIREGRLVALLTPSVRGRGSYWLVWPEARDDYPPLTAFRTWLGEQAAGENQRLQSFDTRGPRPERKFVGIV